MEIRTTKGSPLKILVVRFRAIGDCVMTAYPVTAIRKHAPEAHITWATEPENQPVIDLNHLVNHVAVFPRKAWKRRRWSPQAWREQLQTHLNLRKERFDVGFDFQGHTKTALCLRIAAPKLRFSVPGTDPFARLINPASCGYPAITHEIERKMLCLRAWADLKVPDRPIMPELTVPQLPDRLITIQTGASREDKRIPRDSIAQVGAALLEEGYSVALLGGPEDPHVELPGAIDLVGKTTLLESMAWIRGSLIHMAGDTGTGHIAAAYGVPTLSVFVSLRNPPERYLPLGADLILGANAGEILAAIRAKLA